MLFSAESLLGLRKSCWSTPSSSLSNCSASLSNILPPYSALVRMNVGSDNYAALRDGWHILHRTGYECRSRQRGESFEHYCSHCPGFCVLRKHIYIFRQVLPHKLISCFYVMIRCRLILCCAQIKVDKVIMCCITIWNI